MKIDGKEIANKILSELKVRVQKLKEKGITPTLAIILVGNNPQSVSYIEQKELKATKIGAKVIIKRLSDGTSEKEILNLILKLNKDSKVHGIIVQRPVKGVNSQILNEAVLPEKDVDGFNSQSKFDYPIAKAVLAILEQIYGSNKKIDQFYDYLRKTQIVLIGKGEAGGNPIIQTFKKHQIPFNIVDSQTNEPEKLLRSADIVISAVGKPGVVRPETLKKGVILLSVGLSKTEDGKMRGDYDEEEIKDIASFYTPTPGGVGPVNVAMLLKNLVFGAEKIQ